MTDVVTTTARIGAYSLALDFDAGSVSAGEPVTYTDPNTTINIALSGDGNGQWTANITSAHAGKIYNDVEIQLGDTLPVCQIGDVVFSVQFGSQPGQRIFEAIRATIVGVPATP